MELFFFFFFCCALCFIPRGARPCARSSHWLDIVMFSLIFVSYQCLCGPSVCISSVPARSPQWNYKQQNGMWKLSIELENLAIFNVQCFWTPPWQKYVWFWIRFQNGGNVLFKFGEKNPEAFPFAEIAGLFSEVVAVKCFVCLMCF